MGLRFALFLLVLSALLSSCLFSPEPFDEEQWRKEVLAQDGSALHAPHEKDGIFFNPWMSGAEDRFLKFFKWRLSASAEYTEEEETYLPRLIPDTMARIKALPPGDNFLVWIGHATFLLRIDGLYWLTDPMLSDRALLPKRLTSPALTKEELSDLDGPLTVIISHNHYDHLDTDSLRALPDQARIFVPLGLGAFVQSVHPGEVTELDWWHQAEIGNALLTCLPAQHWSRRIGQGRNTTLWASWIIQFGELTVYYGGDSGYFVGYREIGKQFPGIDYALLPTTAYQPRWFMHYPHINVEEAIEAFNDLQASRFIPTQWGTFRLGDNPPGLPMLELERLIEKRGLDSSRYVRPALGEIVPLAKTKNDSRENIRPHPAYNP